LGFPERGPRPALLYIYIFVFINKYILRHRSFNLRSNVIVFFGNRFYGPTKKKFFWGVKHVHLFWSNTAIDRQPTGPQSFSAFPSRISTSLEPCEEALAPRRPAPDTRAFYGTHTHFTAGLTHTSQQRNTFYMNRQRLMCKAFYKTFVNHFTQMFYVYKMFYVSYASARLLAGHRAAPTLPLIIFYYVILCN
jgi:hypothetical protein